MLRKLTQYRAYLNSFLVLLIGLSLPILAICLLSIAYTVFEERVAIEFFTRPCALAVIGLSFLMGSARGWLFHPLSDEDYRQWLARTPWRLGYPLPKGPIDLRWQDLAIVVALVLINALLALTMPLPSFLLILGPIASYCFGIAAAWSLVTSITGHGRYVLISLTVPLLFRLAGAPEQAFVACPILMMLVVRTGLLRSLADFPWPELQRKRVATSDWKMIGWPGSILARAIPCFPLQFRYALGLSGVIGGWVCFLSASAASGTVEGSASDFHVLVVFATLIAAGTRIAMFRPAICDHLCIGLRFGRKRWFIRKHDQIFVAPILMAIASILLPILLPLCFAVPQAAAKGLTAGLVSIIGLAMGPSVSELYYTGEHSKFGGSISASDRSQSFVTIGGD